MPFRHTNQGWFWGSQGPFNTLAKAKQVAKAAYAHGYKESESEMNPTAEFIATVLHSSTVTHLMHLQVTGPSSFAKHTALGEYYEGIIGLADSLAESIQGAKDEIINDYPSAFAVVDRDPLAYMKSMQAYVKETRASLPQDSEIQNEIDAIMTLINHTVYKLSKLS